MPSFLAGAFALAGLAAAAAPVLIHLLNRKRYRVVSWAAMDFLREALQRNRRVLELRDLLLLALRVACVLLFSLAMARPYFSRASGEVYPDQPVHAVIIIDNSLSMGYQRLDGTLLDEARARARELIERLPAQSRITVLPLCGPSGAFSRDAYRTREDAIEALGAIEVVDRRGTGSQAAELALVACRKEEDLPQKRVIFLGDQQERNWPSGVLDSSLEGLPEMQVVQVAAEDPENAWIADFRLEDGVADVETPAVFAGRIRYEGRSPRRGVQVTLSIDGVVAASQTIDLEPGQSREVSFTHRFDLPVEPGKPSFAAAVLALPPDRLPADDRRFLAAPVVSALPVVFADQYGDEEDPEKNRYGETFRLRRLLAPHTERGAEEKKLVQLRHRRLEQLDRQLLSDARLVVVAGVETPAGAVPLLRDYLRQGGQLVLAAGARFDPRAWTDAGWLGGEGILPLPLLPDALGTLPAEATELKPFHLDPRSLVADLFHLPEVGPADFDDLYQKPFFFKTVVPDAREEVVEGLVEAGAKRTAEERAARQDGSPGARGAEQDRREGPPPAEPPWLTFAPAGEDDLRLSPRELAERERPRVLASFTNGVPFLVERRMGRGRVLFVSSGLHSPWNTLTRTNAVLVFDRIFREALEETLPRRNHETVDEIRLPLQAFERRARFVLHRPGPLSGDGAELERTPEPLAVEALGADVYGLAIRNPVHRGLYRLAALPEGSDGGQGLEAKLWEVALAVNGPESESELRAIDAATLKERLGKAAYRWIGREETITLEGAVVSGQHLWRWLLALALGGLLLELGLLARPALFAARKA